MGEITVLAGRLSGTGRYLTEADRIRIVAAYEKALRRQNNPLTENAETLFQLISQAQVIMTVADAMIGWLVDSRDIAAVDDQALESLYRDVQQLSLEIGVDRAGAGVAPAHSLAAATAIFGAAQPVVAECLTRYGVESPEVEAGTIVHRAIMDRVTIAASTYVDYLLERIHRSHKDERRRLARDLHDMAAPAVAIGLQNIDIFSALRESDPEESQRRLAAARDSLLEATQVIRDLAAQSREAVGRGGLRNAILRYTESVSPEIAVTLKSAGDLSRLPASYCEELYLVTREAIRNAVTHADPAAIEITVDATDDRLRITVADDGRGFDAQSVRIDDGEHIGLFSMRERAELLGGELRVGSELGVGSRVTVEVAIPDHRVHSIVLERSERR
ncbi:sensor histidine kinase [Nocardia sp. SSK8]|uniref:sensor histidine kinase n=1 Tax=Nocardia sp. SSK8 TaxID=3120154 RepID=UPI003009764B